MKNPFSRLCVGMLVVSGSLAATACSTPRSAKPVNTYEGGAQVAAEGEVEPYITGDRQLARDLLIKDVRSKVVDGRLSVQFMLHNKRNRDVSFEWNVDWFDASGFEVDAPDNWRPAVVSGNELTTLGITGPTPAAAMWRLALRRPSSVR